MYNGRGPCLRYGVANRFQTVMECVGVCGGMDYDFFKRITANSNEYARLNMSNEGVFAGTDWTNNCRRDGSFSGDSTKDECRQ